MGFVVSRVEKERARDDVRPDFNLPSVLRARRETERDVPESGTTENRDVRKKQFEANEARAGGGGLRVDDGGGIVTTPCASAAL